MGRKQAGYTLVEIATVMCIIGLIIGGVLKGQALVASSRVHSIMKLQSETQAAIHAFQDRYRALPGDYATASTNINCGPIPCLNGNGNGQIEMNASFGGTPHENMLVWHHLSASGFMSGNYTYDGTSAPSQTNTPVNPYGAYLNVSYDNVFGNGSQSVRHNIKLGNMIPSEILLEVDRKIDDGNPYGGTFQFSQYVGTDVAPSAALCLSSGNWNIDGETNCGAAWLM